MNKNKTQLGPSPRLMTTIEAAEVLGLSKNTLKLWARKDNKLPFGPVRTGRAVRWPSEKVYAYANGE